MNKKPSKLKKIVPKKVPKLRRRKGAEERVREAFANVPRITNETVAEHREDVLRGARKYIYPLKHSRRRVVAISSALFVTALVVFFAYVTVSLYRLQSTSGFLYGVTKVIPLPVAKAGSSWVSYNSYLFELRHTMHYYRTQQGANFDSPEDRQQLEALKQQALDQVIQDAYVKQLAKESNVRVSNRDVDRQIELVRSQNRLGASEKEFEEVLNEFWGWNQNDFRRQLSQEMLAQAVVARRDTEAQGRADAALRELQGGADFAAVANQRTDDQAGKTNGGQFPGPIGQSDANVPAPVNAVINTLPVGQYSQIINAGYSLQIIKVNGRQDGKTQASHIVINLKDINTYVEPLAKKQPASRYIKV